MMRDRTRERALDRAAAALFGLALGDAMGMPTQTLDRRTIRERYGEISGFVDPFDGHPVAHGLRAGQVTDDTEQTVLLARRLTASPGAFDQAGWAADLLAWEEEIGRRELCDLLGPSSKRALTALLNGVPASETGREGTTNGAAMRISPIGIATPAGRPDCLVDRVEAASRLTHNTGEAIAAAAAVAAVIAEGVAGAGFDDALAPALEACRRGQRRGHAAGVADMALLIEQALSLADLGDPEVIVEKIGTSVASRESVPAAFALVRLVGGDPWRAALLAANLGDDTDTIGAIAAGMAAACRGMAALPADAVAHLRRVNSLPMEALAADLLALRHGEAAVEPLEDVPT